MRQPLILDDEGREWYRMVLRDHYDEAFALCHRFLDEATITERECYETDTEQPKKFRYRGRQERVYRFVYCVYEHYPATSNEVIRHRCDNRRCINPAHMILGDRAENHADELEFRAYGVDPRFL